MRRSMLARRRRVFVFILGISVIWGFFFVNLPSMRRPLLRLTPFHTGTYFLDSFDKEAPLLDKDQCWIPNFKPWSESMSPHFKTVSTLQACSEYKAWIYVENGNKLVYNETAIRSNGHFWTLLHCCVTQIFRAEASDEFIRYSECVPSKSMRIDLPPGEFYMVICHFSIMGVEMFEVYRDFVAITPPKGFTRSRVNVKANLPNIVILGIDSTSRLNFRRHMPQTVAKLKDFGAVELLGYTKVGDNTFPNVNAVLSGHGEDTSNSLCFPPAWEGLDDCPWIFKYLSANHGYLTALIEDAPHMSGFTNERIGFIEKPVDYYFRPFMMAVHQHEFRSRNLRIRNYYEGCIGRRTNDETLLDYAFSVMETARDMVPSRPVFILSWSTARSHGDVTGIAHSDSTYASALDTLRAKGYLDNTLLILLSDHGVRFGPARETRQGWYEDKLPAAWVLLGSNIVKRFPEWNHNLRINSRRLSSPFVLHKTFNFLVRQFLKVSHHPIRHITPKTFNLLEEEIPLNTTCRDVRIPELYCTCHYPKKMSTTDPRINNLATEAIGIINNVIEGQPKCHQFNLSRVLAAGSMDTVDERNSTSTKIVAVIEIVPGHFTVEVTSDFYLGTVMGEPNIYRTSKIEPEDFACIWTANALVELWCYCVR